MASLIRKPEAFVALLVLMLGLLGRAVLLESTDLLDPTESRYASVAQQMVESGNWLTPMLPMPEGMVPYLGKPPLHFWLTALSYRLFGVDEWSSRLPSFLAAIGILFAIFLFARKYLGERESIASCLIVISSALFFFLAGASVTDVTLTLAVTASIALLYRFVSDEQAPPKFAFLAAACAGLGFLCKGPVSLVLIWLPFLLWSAVRRDAAWMRRFPWILSLVSFLAVTAPWFVVSEIENPGFVHYFFWNENVARYLFKDYGDRYGSGHKHPFGTSWTLLFGAFAPWSLALVYFVGSSGAKRFRALFRDNEHLQFIACWAISAPLFFTFVRQLHIMYLLPAIPALGMLTAGAFYGLFPVSTRLQRLDRLVRSRYVLLFFVLLWIGEMTVCLSLTFTTKAFSSTLLLAAVGLTAVWSLRRRVDQLSLTTLLPALLIVTYLTAIASITPFLAENQSAELALKSIPRDDRCDRRLHKVGVSTQNTFSHYWTAKAWTSELNEQMEIEYVPLTETVQNDVCHLLIESKHADELPPHISSAFDVVARTDRWWVYGRRALGKS